MKRVNDIVEKDAPEDMFEGLVFRGALTCVVSRDYAVRFALSAAQAVAENNPFDKVVVWTGNERNFLNTLPKDVAASGILVECGTPTYAAIGEKLQPGIVKDETGMPQESPTPIMLILDALPSELALNKLESMAAARNVGIVVCVNSDAPQVLARVNEQADVVVTVNKSSQADTLYYIKNDRNIVIEPITTEGSVILCRPTDGLPRGIFPTHTANGSLVIAPEKEHNGIDKAAEKARAEAEADTYLLVRDWDAMLEADEDKAGGVVFGGNCFGTDGAAFPVLFPGGALSVIAAATGHGKTTFLENCYMDVADALKEKQQAWFFSLEQSSIEILSQLVNLDANALVGGNVYDQPEYIRAMMHGKGCYVPERGGEQINLLSPSSAIVESLGKVKDMYLSRSIGIFDNNISIEEFCRVVKVGAERGIVRAVFLDYIQKLKSDEVKGTSKKELLEYCCDALNALAVETGVPIIAAAQFNRDVASPLDMYAQNIGDASNIEQTAAVILGLWNNNTMPRKDSNYYADGKGNKLSDAAMKLSQRGFSIYEGNRHPAILASILKNRKGVRTGFAVFGFDGVRGKITPLTDYKPTQTGDTNNDMPF